MKERGILLLSLSILVISFLASGFSTIGAVTWSSGSFLNEGEEQFYDWKGMFVSNEDKLCDLTGDGDTDGSDANLASKAVMNVNLANCEEYSESTHWNPLDKKMCNLFGISYLGNMQTMVKLNKLHEYEARIVIEEDYIKLCGEEFDSIKGRGPEVRN